MAKTQKIQPLGDRVLVEPVEEVEQIKGGIYIPDTAKEKPMSAKVIALGTGKLNDDGTLQVVYTFGEMEMAIYMVPAEAE